ncbi:MAG: hypothetical protein ACYC4H_14080 [Desulfocucumaceae bacterium]
MSHEIASVLADKFGLEGDIRSLLVRNIRSLDRSERRAYFERIKTREEEFKQFLAEYYNGGGSESKEKVVRATVNSLLERRGDPDLVDSMVMDVAGRIMIYKNLRERSEREGIKLSALTNFGGLSMVLFTLVIITAIILYLKNA